ncbi:MAG TPA: TolC family protein [Vicinamibacterales bacterium]|nr:TolC family protein [Vicinamibacterales bacterium]
MTCADRRRAIRSPKGLRHFTLTFALVAQSFSPAIVRAQAPVPAERVTFDEAIRRAAEKNPTAAIAAAGILRAEGLLLDARSASRLQINGTVATTTLNNGVEFQGSTVTPQNQVTASLDVRMPLYAPARWARTAQAGDAKLVAQANAEEVRRQTSIATADAYLTIIARRRVVDTNVRARDVAKAHFDYAHELLERGAGSRLNELRAQQEVSLDEGLIESARLALYRAQEALGVLLVADGPVDAGDEPAFAIPADLPPLQAGPWRTDLKLFATQQRAAERVLGDSSKDRLPYFEAVFQPSTTYPAQFFLPQNSWRLLTQLSIPIFDSGQRQALRLERQAAVDESRATFARADTQARSEVRAAREAIASAERGLVSARAAADQARQVVDIVNISFRAGAATNIEVIDAEGRARDADTAAAVAEDTLRRSRLELLTALGRFP